MASPYNFLIQLYDTDGTTPKSDFQVFLRSNATNEKQDQNTDSDGQTIFQLGNFTEGWAVGDSFTFFVAYKAFEASKSFTIVAGGGTTQTLTLVATTGSDELRYFTPDNFLNFFNLKLVEDDAENGINIQHLVLIGKGVEKAIDQRTGCVWDDNDGSYYSVTTTDPEFHDTTESLQRAWFTKFGPVQEITRIRTTQSDMGSDPSWNTVTDQTYYYSVDKETGRIVIKYTPWAPIIGPDTLELAYTYGIATPEDIRHLAIIWTGMIMFGATFVRKQITGHTKDPLNDATWFRNYSESFLMTRQRILSDA